MNLFVHLRKMVSEFARSLSVVVVVVEVVVVGVDVCYTSVMGDVAVCDVSGVIVVDLPLHVEGEVVAVLVHKKSNGILIQILAWVLVLMMNFSVVVMMCEITVIDPPGPPPPPPGDDDGGGGGEVVEVVVMERIFYGYQLEDISVLVVVVVDDVVE